MAAIRELSVNITASTADFERAMQRSGQELTRFGRRVNNVTSNLKRFTLALASISVGAGAVGTVFIKRMFDSVEAAEKLAARLGVATNELLQLDGALSIMGFRAEDVIRAMNGLQVALSKSGAGSNNLRAALADLGIKADDFAKKPLFERLGELARGFGSIADASKRAGLAFNIFGEKGFELVQILRDSGAPLARFLRQAQSFGFGLTPKELDTIRTANEQLRVLSASMRGLQIRSVAALAPAMAQIADAVADWVSTLNTNGPALLLLFEKLAISGARFVDAIAFIPRILAEINLVSTNLAFSLRLATQEQVDRANQMVNEVAQFTQGSLAKRLQAVFDELRARIKNRPPLAAPPPPSLGGVGGAGAGGRLVPAIGIAREVRRDQLLGIGATITRRPPTQNVIDKALLAEQKKTTAVLEKLVIGGITGTTLFP